MVHLALHNPPPSGTSPSPTKAAGPIDDPDLPEVYAAREGDMSAVQHLYMRHRARIMNLARLVLGSASDVEDICHETFLCALSSLNTFRGEATFSAWLCRIAMNQCRNHHARSRTRQKFVVHAQDTEATNPPLAQRTTPELRLALAQAVHHLSEGQREVWVCHDVLGMNHEEIAYVFDCASGTSKAQLHKARLRLRELLSEEK